MKQKRQYTQYNKEYKEEAVALVRELGADHTLSYKTADNCHFDHELF